LTAFSTMFFSGYISAPPTIGVSIAASAIVAVRASAPVAAKIFLGVMSCLLGWIPMPPAIWPRVMGRHDERGERVSDFFDRRFEWC